MQKQFNTGIFIFNIIPFYRPGMSNVFDYTREQYSAAALPSQSQRRKQNTMFLGLENICGTCLSDLDLLYVSATDGDEVYSKINWVDPGSFTLSETGTVNFITNIGWQGNATNGYLSTGYIASTHAVNYTSNDASAFCFIANEVGSSSKVDFGINTGGSSSSLQLISRNGSNAHAYRINHPTQLGRGSGVSSIGFYQIQRIPGPISRIYKDGVTVGTDGTSGSVGLPTLTLPLLANNNNGTVGSFSDRQMGMFGLGASLSGSESDLYTVWNNYFTSL